MARRFSLRPLLRRLSSKHSATAESTRSDGSDNSTAATSASPSPSPKPQTRSAHRRLRKSSSLARLKDKFRDAPTTAPPPPPTTAPVAAAAVPPAAPSQKSRANSVSVIFEDREAAPSRYSLARDVGSEAVEDEEVLPVKSSHSESSDHSSGTWTTAAAAAQQPATPSSQQQKLDVEDPQANPQLTLEEPTPEARSSGRNRLDELDFGLRPSSSSSGYLHRHPSPSLRLSDSQPTTTRTSVSDLPQQSLASSTNASIVNHLVDALHHPQHQRPTSSASQGLPSGLPAATLPKYLTSSSVPDMATMLHRKIWVKRPNASATLVQIREDDLVDDVRDMILRKYANSLGKTFDAPDLTLTIFTRSDQPGLRTARILRPEEEMCRTIDSYYPSGQTVSEALVIDLPQQRTPRPSPRPIYHSHHSCQAMDEYQPPENGTDYFPPMPVTIQPALPAHVAREHHAALTSDQPRSISVLSTGQIPPLPSPGVAGRRHRLDREHRPRIGRQHTSSPTIISHGSHAMQPNAVVSAIPPTHLSRSTRPRVDSSASEVPYRHDAPPPPSLPTPPAAEAPPVNKPGSGPPTPNTLISNGGRTSRPRKTRKPTPGKPSKGRSPPVDTYNPNRSLTGLSSVLDSSVPPINVLIVEDNIINMRILEGLMKRLNVRWQTAMNGQIAVDKWRTGGYHLVLMDIQMPIMNGLQATKEIRRLERVNGIGVFSATPGPETENGPGAGENGKGEKVHNAADDKLDKSTGVFKSPIIIVALTASSLQSDRHEALAAGCNDFLTKPVNFVWLERKVKEWGCMQALIDYDGWRQWKDFAEKENAGKSEEEKQKDREQEEKQKKKMEKLALLQEKQRKTAEAQAKEKEKERKKQESTEQEPPDVNGTAA